MSVNDWPLGFDPAKFKPDPLSPRDLGALAMDHLVKAHQIKKMILEAQTYATGGGAGLTPQALAFLRARIARYESDAHNFITQGGE